MQTGKRFTATHRLLHWVMAFAMPVLFITGFLRMEWMNRHKIADYIRANTAEGAVTQDQLKAIGKAIREPMWEWHILFAKIMIAAFVLRIIYMIAKGIRFPNPFKSGATFSTRIQGLTYIYFYLFVFINAVTGIALEYKLFSEWKQPIEAVHKWGLYWFPIFILLHFAGVALSELNNRKGITSKMIGGD